MTSAILAICLLLAAAPGLASETAPAAEPAALVCERFLSMGASEREAFEAGLWEGLRAASQRLGEAAAAGPPAASAAWDRSIATLAPRAGERSPEHDVNRLIARCESNPQREVAAAWLALHFEAAGATGGE